MHGRSRMTINPRNYIRKGMRFSHVFENDALLSSLNRSLECHDLLSDHAQHLSTEAQEQWARVEGAAKTH